MKFGGKIPARKINFGKILVLTKSTFNIIPLSNWDYVLVITFSTLFFDNCGLCFLYLSIYP